MGGCAVFALSILVPCVACGYEEPVYTVTVAGGTNSLDEATVEVTQNGETTTAAFSSLTLNQGGTFVKKGMGWLQSSTAMSVFTGEIVVAARFRRHKGMAPRQDQCRWQGNACAPLVLGHDCHTQVSRGNCKAFP